ALAATTSSFPACGRVTWTASRDGRWRISPAIETIHCMQPASEPAVESPAAAPGAILECRNLWRVFQSGDTQLEVLRGVDFTLFEGEIAGIMGSSGAGKSTLLHLLGLLDTPTSGEILYRGRDLSRL